MAVKKDNYTKVTSGKELWEKLNERLGKRTRLAGHGVATTIQRASDQSGLITVVYHSTAVVSVWPDGTIQLRNGGHHTPTTKSRINEYMPHCCGVYQKQGDWYLRWVPSELVVFPPYVEGEEWDANNEEWERIRLVLEDPKYIHNFRNGMTISPEGEIVYVENLRLAGGYYGI